VSTPRDFAEFNARKPVIGVRFTSVDEWRIVADAARRAGMSLCAYLRTTAVREATRGNQPSNSKTDRTLAKPRTA
jgi:hypothetical protein